MPKEILIVDDEEDIRYLVKALLRDKGYSVTEAENGKKALEILKSRKFDLLLLDYFMPEMNGRQVAEEIRKNPSMKDARIAFLTVAQFGEFGEKRLKELKISDYIKKPIDNNDFVSRIKRILK